MEPLEDRCVPAGGITEFSAGIPPVSTPTSITRGADGNLWFTEFDTNSLARITPSGTVTQFPLSLLGAVSPDGITSGPNGRLYFTGNSSGTIGSIDPLAGNDAAIGISLQQSAVVPSGAGASLEGITTGPDGNLWFTENGVDRIGNVSPDLTTINEFSTGISAGAHPAGIALGADGNLWFTESGATPTMGGQTVPKIGRITTGGTVTEFPLGVNSSQQDPEGITAGPNGTLWFAENGSDQIGRITTAGTVTEFPRLPSATSGPLGITLGLDGNLWFTESTGNQIGRITPAGAVTEYGTGITANSTPTGITTGPDGNIWFTESTVGQVAKLVPDAPLNATPFANSATATLPANLITVANFTDGSPSAVPTDFSVSINWGDGTPVDTTSGHATAIAGQPGNFSVSGSHTYATAGNFNAVVTITDNATNSTMDVGGNTATATSTITVSPVGTQTSLSVTPGPLVPGQVITLTATVTPNAGSSVPTGFVTFLNGGAFLGSSPLNGAGKATLTTALPVGGAALTAIYSGSPAQTPSSSAAVGAVVSPNVTSLVMVTVQRPRRGSDHRLHRKVTLVSRSAFLLPGPLFLALDGLAAGRLRNRSGVTHVFPPLNSPVILVSGTGIAPGQSITIDLVFNGSASTSFTPRVLAGTPLV